MQKIIDRYESKISDMQKQIDSLVSTSNDQHEQNERLNDELTDLTDLHQMEMSSIKTDLKNLEDRLLYKFNDYWNELLEKLDKLDTRVSLTYSGMKNLFLKKFVDNSIILYCLLFPERQKFLTNFCPTNSRCTTRSDIFL